MEVTQLTLAILALPFIGFVALGLWGKTVFRSAAGIVSTLLLSGAAVLSWVVAAHYFFPEGSAAATHPLQVLQRWSWLVLPNGLTIEVGLLLDPAAVMMLIVVTGVSLLVHIFSMGYMKGESRYPTYFAYLSLFTFSMLGIVLSSNLFQIYMFWELVGLSSFLLISFYFYKPAALAASKKAFIVTRFADLGFLIGILILSFQGESLDVPTLLQRFTDVQSGFYAKAAATSFLGFSVLTWGLLLIFMGGAGKSAMFPLHIWLPDAMEGPTPVSALIHAATMVVAGVYLVARLFPLFSLDAVAMQAIALIGIFSAVLAAVIACTQSDLKRVLAYSTMSQIGFMMFSLGVARNTPEQQLGYTASLFHLFTHAFFKSLLFLAAGAIIHYVHSNDIFAMGGLRKKMPITHFSFLVACLAISGVPFFSGFFSKEE
ncbi:MAG: NADH-quinone oxidoreductase subunit L, partial [Chitinophagaceae bacterium]